MILNQERKAVCSDKYLIPIKNKRRNIKANPIFKDYVHDNKVEKYETTNTRPFKIPEAKNSPQYKHSFFVRTICDWDRQDNSIVNAESVDIFKTQLKKNI